MGNCGECENRWMCNEDPNACTVGTEPALVTNADRIRAMSDIELAAFIADNFCHGFGGPQILTWLQQPAGEE